MFSDNNSNNNETGQEDLPVAQTVSSWSTDDVEANQLHPYLLAEEPSQQIPSGSMAATDKKSEDVSEHRRFKVSTPQQPSNAGYGSIQYWGRFNDPHVHAAPATINDKNDNENYGPVATARQDDRQIRLQFIPKIYLILSAQLLVTFGICAMIALHESTRQFVVGSGGTVLFYTNFVICLVLICSLSVYKRQYPINFVLLSVFTVSMAFMVGTVTAIYAEMGAGDLVLEAIFITATVFIALTIYTLQSKWDFSFLGAGLGMCLWIMILWGLFGIIFGISTGSVYALLGSVLFSLYIVYDTYMIAERLDPEDYIVAAIELYLDLVNLFLYILRLLSETNS